METYSKLSLATRRARELSSTTGLSYYVACYDDDGQSDYFVVRYPTEDMIVWRRITEKWKRK